MPEPEELVEEVAEDEPPADGDHNEPPDEQLGLF